MKTKYHHTFLCGGVVEACSSAKPVHQKSKPVMLLSQVEMFAIDSIRDSHELLYIIQYNSF